MSEILEEEREGGEGRRGGKEGRDRGRIRQRETQREENAKQVFI